MKKIVSLIAIFLVLFFLTYSFNSYAASMSEELKTVQITTDKATVHPQETVTLNISFGTDMGAYTANVAYDANLLEYVSADGGLGRDTGEKVIVTYAYNQLQDPSPRNSMSITFKAKEENITTTNPTSLTVSLEGLANPNATIEYYLTTSQTIKELIVEPIYEDYKIALNYTGDILPEEEKDMEIVISSSMGKNFAKTRLVASVTGPEGQDMQLLAQKDENDKYDIIESGWGSEQGDAIGGKNVAKKIQARGIFSGEGTYNLTLKLINRDDGDAVIASNTFEIKVGKTSTQTPDQGTTPEPEPQTPPTTTTNKTPNTLPKTGNTIYASIISIIVILVSAYIVLKKKD